MYGTERIIIFTNRKFVAIDVRSTLQEKTEFLARLPYHSIMIAFLMLVYHVILCKFILYLKSLF